MGGSSKKVTVGYKYYLGIHLVLCHGPIDYISQIKVDNRLAWNGFSNGGRVSINKPGLFGGEDREGGVSGSIDIEMGEATQGTNDYLRARLGQNIPAFRGVVSAVLRQCYLGMNPYLKPWAFRATRTNVTSSGEVQWYMNKAAIGSTSNAALYLAIDDSGSMLEMSSNGKTRLQNMKEALDTALSPLRGLPNNSSIDIMVVAFGNSRTAIVRRAASGQDVEDTIDWIYARTGGGTATDFNQAVAEAPNFFSGAGSKRRVSVFLTDGEPNPTNSYLAASATLLGVSGIEAYGINIDLEDTSATAYLDNTAIDGVPVAKSGDGASIQAAVTRAISSHFDMNPAHIIRECLTDSVWGMGYLPADIDDASFSDCADVLFNEQMGISLLWDRQIPIEEFVSEIVRHINATLYVDKVTGRFTLKLIRNDYDIETIPILDESNIAAISDYSRVDPGDAINSISVVYWNAETGENASVTADDPALIQAYGTVVNTTIQYPGFSNAGLAARAAARDLQTLSSPLLSCAIEATRAAADLNIGDVFKLVWPKYHDGYVVMRVHQISFGDGKKNAIKIKASEDVFSLPATSLVGNEETGWEEPGGPPLPPPIQIVEEAPYFELVQQFGQTQLDSLLSETPEVGYLQVAATRPEHGLNAQIWVDSGAGFGDGGPLDFSPAGKLLAPIGILDTHLTLSDWEDLEQVQTGTHAQIGKELVRVDAVDPELGTLTIGRAVLDTIPSPHSAGTPIVFWDLYAASNLIEYVAGEVLDVRVLTNSSQGTLEVQNGTTESVTMNQRAYRPFRPAGLRAGGFLDPQPSWYPVYPVPISWAGRNRVQETSGTYLAWTDPGVTPEPGTNYRVTVEAIDETGNVAGQVLQTLTGGSASYALSESSIPTNLAGLPFMRVTVTAVRDGLDSFTSPSIQFRGPFREPGGLTAIYRAPRAPQRVQISQAY